jgi:hypothetical protein
MPSVEHHQHDAIGPLLPQKRDQTTCHGLLLRQKRDRTTCHGLLLLQSRDRTTCHGPLWLQKRDRTSCHGQLLRQRRHQTSCHGPLLPQKHEKQLSLLLELLQNRRNHIVLVMQIPASTPVFAEMRCSWKASRTRRDRRVRRGSFRRARPGFLTADCADLRRFNAGTPARRTFANRAAANLVARASHRPGDPSRMDVHQGDPTGPQIRRGHVISTNPQSQVRAKATEVPRRTTPAGVELSGSHYCHSYTRAMPLFLFEPDQRRFVRAFGAFVLICAWLVSR